MKLFNSSTLISIAFAAATTLFSGSSTAVSASNPAKPVSSEGIEASAYDVRPLLPGMKVANTCIEDKHKNSVCTKDLFAEKPTVLVVYRGGWCPYCNAQLNGMKKVESAIEFLGFQIVAVSPDSNKNIAEQQSREEIAYQLLADPELALAKEMGLAFFLDKKTEAMYRDKLGVPFIDINGDSRVALPVPAVYIIDQQGMVHFQYVNPNYDVRLSEALLYKAAEETMKAINANKMKSAE